MKGWCQLALKVFLYTCGAVVGGLCVAFGIGLLTAGPASAATQGFSGGVLGSAASSAVSGTASQAASAVTSAGSAVGDLIQR
ncbi:MAG: hypothetical protein ACRDPF_28070 [Streptosporangiaceae bacterium]